MKYDELDLLLGQMFIFGFHEQEINTKIVEHYRSIPAGGIILFRRNINNVKQVTKMTADLQDLANTIRPGDPLLIAVDQEGGNLSPLRDIVTSLPGNMGLAASGDPAAAYFAGFTTGNDLKSMGINLNFAPVLDLALQANPVVSTRAFSDKPEVAAVFGKEYVKGLLASGTLFTAKHFPGHGSCTEDSHIDLPNCDVPYETLLGRDLIPFHEVIKLELTSLMMAHVKYVNLDAQYPASLSAKIIMGLLREKIGFKGVVITDCLEMNAVQKFLPYPEDAVRAIEAGNDLILISHTLEHQQASFRAARDAVETGRIKISRIEESVNRINEWKKGIGKESASLRSTSWSPSLLAEKVITFKDSQQNWEFDNQPLILITPEMGSVTLAEDFGEVDRLESELEKCAVPCTRLNCSENPSEEEINHLIFQINAKESPKVIFVVSNVSNSPGQVGLIRRIAKTKRVLLISTRNPREVAIFGKEFPIIFTYSTEISILKALAKALSGIVRPQGKVPIFMDGVSR